MEIKNERNKIKKGHNEGNKKIKNDNKIQK